MMTPLRRAFERWFTAAYTDPQLEWLPRSGYMNAYTAVAYAAWCAGRAYISPGGK